MRVHDCVDEQSGKVITYGVFDLSRNEGWVSVGIDHDTAQFAVQAIGRWWQYMGATRYPQARELLITADWGGSNGSRCRLWKVALQELATRLGLPIHVRHFPPGTSTWNKIEHRMFSHMTQNWRGRPLVSHEVMINVIANTTTRAGLRIRTELDRGQYPTGIKTSDAELKRLNLQHAQYHDDWNYASPSATNEIMVNLLSRNSLISLVWFFSLLEPGKPHKPKHQRNQRDQTHQSNQIH